MSKFPLGKLPPELLAKLLAHHAPNDPRVLLGPGIGLDCAVLDFGDRLLVAKSDPITFTADEIGWFAVHVTANDVATTGAQPRWFLATVLLPEQAADQALVSAIFGEIAEACAAVGAQLVGGHSEITVGLDRPILAGTMLGEVARERLITPRGAKPGDRLLLTKGVPIEATAILARDFADRLANLPQELVNRARNYLHQPGISVVREALAAAEAGGVTAMHDPTEGGLASGLWELALACGHGLEVDLEAVHVPLESQAVCQALGVDPIEAIASGALLLSVEAGSVETVRRTIEDLGITTSEIGSVIEGEGVWRIDPKAPQPVNYPKRDAIARLFRAE